MASLTQPTPNERSLWRATFGTLALAVLGCSSEAACADLAGVLDSLRKDLAPLIRRELGDDPFAAAKISVAGRVVRVEMELAPTRAAAILLRLMQR